MPNNRSSVSGRTLRRTQTRTRGSRRLPAREDDLLNLRDFEQGLEQMKCVGSQDVDMQIAPSDVAGESDVIETGKRSKPRKIVAAVDNSGTRIGLRIKPRPG